MLIGNRLYSKFKKILKQISFAHHKVISDKISSLIRDICRENIIGLFLKVEKELELIRKQSSQNPNKDGKLFTQIYIEVARLLSYKPGYERFEGTIRLIKLKIT